jgi:hypothetical protein
MCSGVTAGSLLALTARSLQTVCSGLTARIPRTVRPESDNPSLAIRIVIIIVGNALLLEGAASTSY